MNSQIIRNNLVQEIASLNNERAEIARLLSVGLKEYETLQSKIEKLEASTNGQVAKCNEKITEAQKKLYLVNEQVANSANKVQIAEKKHKSITKSISESINKLESINFRIFSAENELSNLEVKCKSLGNTIKEQTIINNDLLAENQRLRDKNNELLSSNSDLREQISKISRNLDIMINEAYKQMEQVVKEASNAENTLAVFDKKKRDLDLYANRIKKANAQVLKKLRYANRPK